MALRLVQSVPIGWQWITFGRLASLQHLILSPEIPMVSYNHSAKITDFLLQLWRRTSFTYYWQSLIFSLNPILSNPLFLPSLQPIQLLWWKCPKLRILTSYYKRNWLPGPIFAHNFLSPQNKCYLHKRFVSSSYYLYILPLIEPHLSTCSKSPLSYI